MREWARGFDQIHIIAFGTPSVSAQLMLAISANISN
jgi:hypothetical protein